MKLIKGKKVRIIDSSKFWKTTKESELNNNFMCGYCGKIATIIIVHNEGDSCSLDIDGKAHCWNKDYLMPYRQRKSDNIKKVVKPKTRKMWVAMDEDGQVYLSSLKPKLDKNLGVFFANNKDSEYMYIGCNNIVKKLLPNLTYENSPQKIKLSVESITK